MTKPSLNHFLTCLFIGTFGTYSPVADEISGLITTNTTWFATNSPYVLSGSVTVANQVTLTIQPGTSVYLRPTVDLVITNGGRLLAEGTAEAPIRLTRLPNTRPRWGGIIIAGGLDSPETRLTHAFIQGNDYTAIYSSGGTVWLDYITFGTRDRQYLSLDRSSFVISHCHLPTTTGEFEPVHGVGGIKAGGRGIIRECFFGGSDGYSDIIDFTGGNREKNQPIIQFNNNVLPMPWNGPGRGNVVVDPKFKYVPQLAETRFTNWAGAQILREWFSLQPGSPALGTGPNGRDKGGVIPLGASISGEPTGPTDRTTAELTVGLNRRASGIPAQSWPNGSGYTHIRTTRCWEPARSLRARAGGLCKPNSNLSGCIPVLTLWRSNTTERNRPRT